MKPENNESENCAGANTDVEIWRKVRGDYYSPSIHVNEFGSIGINVGGRVLVLSVEQWHEAGDKIFAVNSKLPNWKRKLAYRLLRWQT